MNERDRYTIKLIIDHLEETRKLLFGQLSNYTYSEILNRLNRSNTELPKFDDFQLQLYYYLEENEHV